MSRLKGVELRELWRARLLRFEGLGQTVAEFCQWEGVSIAAFYVWRKKLRVDAAPKRRTTVPAKSVDTHHRSLFVPVVSAAKTVAAKTVAAGTVAARSAVVVMTLSDGTRVELPASDHQLIAHVVTSVVRLQGGER